MAFPFKKILMFSKRMNHSPGSVLPVYIISGSTKGNGVPITMAYAGHDQKKMVQWSLLIMDHPLHQQIGVCPLSTIKRFLKKRHPLCSLLFIETEWANKNENLKAEGIPLPCLMQTYIDISEPVEAIVKRSRAGFENVRRLICKYQLTYEMTTSPEAQRDFYDNMYLPYLKERLGICFKIVEFSGVFSPHFPFEMIRIKKEGQVMAGGVLHFKNDRVYFAFIGARKGVFDSVREGAFGAAYYFLCKELHQRGIKKLCLGGSPPFTNHPLTRHKIRMTVRLDKEYRYQDHELVSCFLLRNSEGTKDFLLSSPFLFVNGCGKMSGMIWLKKGQYATRQDFEKNAGLLLRLGCEDNIFVELDGKSLQDSWYDFFQKHNFRKEPIGNYLSS